MWRFWAQARLSLRLASHVCCRSPFRKALAPLFALFHEKEFLAQKAVLWFIDNLGVLSCLCKGSSVVADISCLIHASLMGMAALRLQSWYEHVDSKANCSDAGTRGQTVALGVNLRSLPLPPWPTNTVSAPPEVWLAWLKRHFKVKSAFQPSV